MNINVFLGHLNKVRKGKSGWMACCPNHEDNSPSLAITQGSDFILIHCFAGCCSKEVMRSIGLTMADLYQNRNHPERSVMRWNDSLLKAVIFHERVYIAMCQKLTDSSRQLTPTENARVALAKQRLSKAMEVLNV